MNAQNAITKLHRNTQQRHFHFVVQICRFVSGFRCLIVVIMAAAASTPPQPEEQVSLKLVVNKETNRVLFAEAGKDFVDVLCSFLTLPLGTIARLVGKESNMGPVTVGCLNSLYQSVVDLDKECLWTETSKELLLHPRNSSEGYCSTLELNVDDTEPQKYFICSSGGTSHGSISATSGASCGIQWCRCLLTSSVSLKHFSKGFVNSAATFIITDELIVMPNSLDYTSFGLLQNLGIKSPSSVKEMTVNVTKQKVVDLLKCSLLSQSTLTDLFLGNKPLILERSKFFSCSVENSSDISSIQIKLKLVIRKSDGKILYAQGQQDFANLLISFLTFPLGGVVRKLGGNSSVGSIDQLYKSIADLNECDYMMSIAAKNRLVAPYLAPEYYKLSKLILPVLEPSVLQYYCFSSNNSTIHVQFFKDGEHYSEVWSFSRMNLSSHPISATGSHDGYVKGPAMYLVTDDLVMAPLSPISALDLLNRLKTPFNDLKEKVVTIGIKECLGILKASLTSTSALTNGLNHLLTEVKEEK